MRTGFYEQSLAEDAVGPGLLFLETEPPRRCPRLSPMCNLQAPNDNAFVNTVEVDGALLAVTDSPVFVDVDATSLNVTGVHAYADDLEGKVSYTGSAHALRDARGRPTTFLGNAGLDDAEVVLYAFDRTNRTEVARLTMPTAPYMHSFGLTERHAVLRRQPLFFDATKVMTGPMRDAFVEIDAPRAGRRETENGFYLVPLDGSAPRVYSLPPTDRLYYTHTVNAYENASGVVVDLCTLPGNPFVNAGLTVDGFRNKTARDAGEGTAARRAEI